MKLKPGMILKASFYSTVHDERDFLVQMYGKIVIFIGEGKRVYSMASIAVCRIYCPVHSKYPGSLYSIGESTLLGRWKPVCESESGNVNTKAKNKKDKRETKKYEEY